MLTKLRKEECVIAVPAPSIPPARQNHGAVLGAICVLGVGFGISLAAHSLISSFVSGSRLSDGGQLLVLVPGGNARAHTTWAYSDFGLLEKRLAPVARVAASGTVPVTVTSPGGALRLKAALVSSDYFS